MFLSSSAPYEVPDKQLVTSLLQDKICEWISAKSLTLSEPQYSCMKSILDNRHVIDSVDLNLINKNLEGSSPILAINQYEVFNYP